MKLRGEIVEEEEDYEIKSDDEDKGKCGICSEEAKEPMITKCNHIFCEKCIVQSLRKTMRCPVCKEETSGILNNGQYFIDQWHKKKAKKKTEKKEEKFTPTTGWLIP